MNSSNSSRLNIDSMKIVLLMRITTITSTRITTPRSLPTSIQPLKRRGYSISMKPPHLNNQDGKPPVVTIAITIAFRLLLLAHLMKSCLQAICSYISTIKLVQTLSNRPQSSTQMKKKKRKSLLSKRGV